MRTEVQGLDLMVLRERVVHDRMVVLLTPAPHEVLALQLLYSNYAGYAQVIFTLQ